MKIYEKLKAMPLLHSLSFNTLSPVGTGLFPQGIVRCGFDVTGGTETVKKYILRHRGTPEDPWVEEVTACLLAQGYAVTGGKLTAPTGDGFGTWELEFEVKETTGGLYEN